MPEPTPIEPPPAQAPPPRPAPEPEHLEAPPQPVQEQLALLRSALGNDKPVQAAEIMIWLYARPLLCEKNQKLANTR